jgi:hypothetical protein
MLKNISIYISRSVLYISVSSQPFICGMALNCSLLFHSAPYCVLLVIKSEFLCICMLHELSSDLLL